MIFMKVCNEIKVDVSCISTNFVLDTRAKVTTDDLEEQNSKVHVSNKVGKRLRSNVDLGEEYSGKVVSRNAVEKSDEESEESGSEDDEDIDDKLHNINQRYHSFFFIKNI